jgi:RNA polymerase sigma-70 factor, ECF subfamily
MSMTNRLSIESCGAHSLVGSPLPAPPPLASMISPDRQKHRPSSEVLREAIVAAQAGNQEAMELLIQRFDTAVYRLCFRILAHPEQAQDARQETFLRMLRSLVRFDPNRNFATWLFAIATHVALDMASRKRHMPATEAPVCSAGPDPLQTCILQEDIKYLEVALQTLPPKTRALLALRFQEGLAPAHISRILDVSANQVRVDLWRARLVLRQAVDALKKK